MTDAPQTAMMLTQQEWDDLAVMVGSWQRRHEGEPTPPNSHAYHRRHALAERIIEANQ